MISKRKKTLFGIACLVMAVLMLFQGNVTAAGLTELDRVSARAGASLALNRYFESNRDAADRIVAMLKPLMTLETDDRLRDSETFYREPKIGTVCCEGSLNVRSSTSVFSEILVSLWRGTEVQIVSELQVRGVKWYHIQFGETAGYVAGQYVLFGDDVQEYFAALHEKLKNEAVIPTGFTVPDPYDHLDKSTVEKITECVKQINYVLKNDYPAAERDAAYLNMYSILIYLMENYRTVANLAKNNGLQETYAACAADIQTVEYLRETLRDITGKTDEDFSKQIQEVQAERARQARNSLGEQIADFAAQFVGTLPYVWGGSSLTRGADCSGFAAQIYASFGLFDKGMADVHGFDSTSLRGVGVNVPLSQIFPGDLVCYNGHVAIYYGGGMVVHEPSPGKRCSFGSLYMLPIICVRRLY